MSLDDIITPGEAEPGEASTGSQSDDALHLSFGNNGLLPMLCGEHDQHLTAIEKAMQVDLNHRGGHVAITGGDKRARNGAKTVLENIYGKIEQGQAIGLKDVEAAIRMVGGAAANKQGRTQLEQNGAIQIRTKKKTITPYSNHQADYIRQMQNHELAFALGPAGTGKTYLAVAVGVSYFISGQVERIILSRPAVEAGEKLGYLPGDMREKIDPYLRPLYDALHDMLPAEKVVEYIENGTIEIAPLAFMRGRTLTNAYVILDEAQNATPVQMKMFLTRLGENSRMVVTGDLSQTDLPRGMKSGLRDAVERLDEVEGVSMMTFGDQDVVRHELTARIIRAYDARDREIARERRENSEDDG